MNKNKPDMELIPSGGGVLSCLAWTQKELQQKLKSGRFRDMPLEKARNEKIRLLVYTCQVLAGVLKDSDLDDLRRRVEALEEKE